MYQFGSFRVKVAERRLERTEEILNLQPKTFDLLVYFIQNPGRLIRKEELLDHLWPDSHVEEANLAVHVSALRKALGGAPDEYILTVPKFGYRFVAEVIPIEASTPAPPLTPKSRNYWPLLALPVLILAALAYFSTRQRVELWNPIPVTATTALEISPALSPDGKQIVYSMRGYRHSSTGPETAGLRLKNVDSDELVVLTQQADYNAAWSPDGKEIAFIRYTPLPGMNNEASLVLRSISNGQERNLLKINYRGALPGPSVSYTPDGKMLLTSLGTGFFDASSPRRLVAISRATGEATNLLDSPKGVLGDSNPLISPKGDKMVFCRCTSINSCDLYEVAMSGLKPKSDPQRVTNFGMPDLRAVYLADGSLLYPSGPVHAHVLWRKGKDFLGRTINQQISSAGEDITHPTVSLSPDGTARLVYIRNESDSNIWEMDFSNPASAQPRISSNKPDQTPAYSPDGTQIAFSSTRSGMWEIWTCDASGKQCHQITHLGPAHSRNPTWSPDGKSIIFESRGEGEPQLYRVDLPSGTPMQISTGQGAHTDPVWTQDGKWLYFTCNRSGRPEIYRIPASQIKAPASAPYEQVTPFGGSHAQLSPDGKILLFTGIDFLSYRMRVDLPDSLATLLPKYNETVSFLYPPAAGLGSSSYGLLFDGTKSFLGRMDWATQKAEQFHPARFDRNFSLALSPKEDKLLWVQTDSMQSDLMMVSRFIY